MVELMAAYRMPHDEMVLVIQNPTSGKPISPITLRKHFAPQIQQGYAKGRMRIMAASFKSATGWDKDTPGNVTAQIWLQKTLYGIRETVSMEGPVAPTPVEAAAENSIIEGARRVAFALALGANAAERVERIKGKG